MRRVLRECATAAIILWMLVRAVAVLAGPREDLARARQLYNSGKFSEAIAAAETGRKDPALASAAGLVIARARLEQYRLSGDAADLSAARVEFAGISAVKLSARDTIEWQVGVAETLFLEGQPGAAAELFRSLIAPARPQLTPREMEKLLEWWAGALSQRAEGLSPPEHAMAYRQILASMEVELDRNPLSRTAAYWIPAAARGAGDLDRSGNAAVAGWVRAGAMGTDGAALRADLERLVLQGLIPERAQRRTGLRLDDPATIAEMAAMSSEWEALTGRWAGKD